MISLALLFWRLATAPVSAPMVDDSCEASMRAAIAAETIAARCPSTWAIKRSGNGWRYSCKATRTVVRIIDGNNHDSAGLTGTTEGDSDASWTR